MSGSGSDPLIGTRIREYEILDIVGRGGMGAVYRARHVYLDEERAIKLIQTQLAEKENLANRFIREARILTKLKHRNLVQLYEFGMLEDQKFFMVLEFLQGESVLQRINRSGRIPPFDALHIIRQAALGLEVAHQQNVIHRDISPDNLLLVKDAKGEEIVKVIDFGIAKPTVDETQKYTVENMFLGKLEYSSPEQCGFHEVGEKIDPRSDIYSLGVTLYHMLSAKLPFYSQTPQGYLVKHASEIPKPVSSHLAPGELPSGLDELLMKMLSKNRGDRPSSMSEFVKALEQIRSPFGSGVVVVEPPNIEFAPGYLFARRYLIEEKIGRGGMGIVYRALDKMLEVTVALKVINPLLSDNPNTLERFKREVILARKVAHRNVCRIYDFGQSGGIHYVSMELLEGRTLAEVLLKDGAFTIEKGIPILVQVLKALAEAHESGIVHRDLKPQNIILDKNNRAVITDFGISTSIGSSRLTQTGALIGTPRYMAPEQFGNWSIDNRADIYSMSIIMFEMFTAKLPYEAHTPANVMYAHLHSPPLKPSRFAEAIPSELEAIILKGLEKDPNERFQSVSELLEALEPFWKPLRRDLKDATWTRTPPEFNQTASVTEARPSSTPPPITESALQSQLTPPTETKIPQRTKVNTAAITEPQPAGISKEQSIHTPVPDAIPPARTASSKTGFLIGGGVLFFVVTAALWMLFGSKNGDKPAPVQTPATKSAEQTGNSPPQPQVDSAPPKVITPPATTREVAIDTSPAGASIYINGEDSGLQTPAKISLKADETPTIALQLKGYEKVERSVDANSPSRLLLQLVPSVGQITYKGDYPVSIYEGKKLLLQAKNGSSLSLPSRSYNLVLTSTNKAFIREMRRIDVKPGETTFINGPAVGTLSVTANPSNCKIYIDDVFVDSPPIFNFPVQSGSHMIKVSWEKLGKEKAQSFLIEPGKTLALRAVTNDETTGFFESTN